jgi:hypothetical protein
VGIRSCKQASGVGFWWALCECGLREALMRVCRGAVLAALQALRWLGLPVVLWHCTGMQVHVGGEGVRTGVCVTEELEAARGACSAVGQSDACWWNDRSCEDSTPACVTQPVPSEPNVRMIAPVA